MTNWEIKACRSFGPLRLGMTRKDVGVLGDVLGDITDLYNSDGLITEYRNIDRPNTAYRNDILVFVGSGPQVKGVAMSGIELFECDPAEALRTLERIDSGCMIDLDLIVFPSLCIHMTNFYFGNEKRFFEKGRDQDDRAINLTSEKMDYGQFNFQPISFL